LPGISGLLLSAHGQTSVEYADMETGQKPQTPLRIIGLFIGLTEIIVGTVVTQTTGTVQMILTIFVIAFPLLIAAAFFALLWDRPQNLYPPSEYGGGTTAVSEFVEAMHRRTSDMFFDVHSQLRDTIDGLDATKAKALVAKVAAEFTEVKRFIAVQYPRATSTGDANGSKAKTVLKRAVTLTVNEREDADKWQSAIRHL